MFPRREAAAFFCRVLLVAACLMPAGCKPESGNVQAELQGLREKQAQTEAQLRETQAQLRAQSPTSRTPMRLQPGKPQQITAELLKQGPVQRGDDCPGDAFTIIRTERGTSCDTYEAEISSWVDGCFGDCDKNAMATQTIRNAMARCSEWCTIKKCNKASFIPPEDGCGTYDCYVAPEHCPNQNCPKREYCSLKHGDSVFNCLCRDVIEA